MNEVMAHFRSREGQHFGSDQERAKIAVIAPHEDFDGGAIYFEHDDVTSLEVEHAARVRYAMISSRNGWLYHGNEVVVHINIDSSTGTTIVKLCVDVVPSMGGHSQFSALVLHAACKMAEWGIDRPVFYHCKVILNNLNAIFPRLG